MSDTTYTYDDAFLTELTALLTAMGDYLPDPERRPSHQETTTLLLMLPQSELQKAEGCVALLRAQAHLRMRYRAVLDVLRQRGKGNDEDASHCCCGSITCATHGCTHERLRGIGAPRG